MTHTRRLLAAAALLLLPAAASAAIPKLYFQETDHVKVVYYNPAHEYLVKHVIRCFETAFNFDRAQFQYRPSGKVTILLDDFQDFAHGGATSIPNNLIGLGIEPLASIFETMPGNERLGSITTHELIHIVMGDGAAGRDLAFRSLFGGKVAADPLDPVSMLYSQLTSPRYYAPRWYHEGIAVFFETMLNGGVGRAMSGFDEMNFRAMVRDEAYFYQFVGLEAEGNSVDFKTATNAYLYGTRFLTHLVYAHGPAKFTEWVSRAKGSKPYFTAAFQQVYGESLEHEWAQWIADETAWQKANLKRIQEFPVSKFDRIGHDPMGSVSRPYFDPQTNVIYTASTYFGQAAQIAAIHLDTGKVDRLHDVDGPSKYMVTSLAYDAKGRRIFYASDNSNWRDLKVLDLATGKTRRLMRDSRAGDFVYSTTDGSLWGLRHSDGLTSLVHIPPPFDKIEQVRSFEYGTDFIDLDLSPDGRYLSGILTDISGRQKLVRIETAKVKQAAEDFEVLHDFEFNSPGNFVYSPDGRYLVGSSYYTGVSNLWRYDFETKKTDILSNSETGLFRPLPLPDGRMIAFEMGAKGLAPGIVDAKPLQDVNAIPYFGQAMIDKYPELKDWKLPSPSAIHVDSLIRHYGYYSPPKKLQFISAYPIVQGYKDSAAAGMRVELADSIHVLAASITASYSPDGSLPWNERFHGGFDAHYFSWRLSGYYNNADFYDLFGPTKNARKGYAAQLQHTHHLLYDTPRTLDLVWDVAGYGGMDRLPDAQNVAVTHKKFAIGRTALNYSAKQQSLGAIEDEKGVAWTLNTRTAYAGRSVFPLFYGTAEKGWQLPLHNSSLWVRGAGGKAFGDVNDPFGNFYFGSFGNNWVDHQDVSRYRQYYAFPGVGLDAIGANNFGKAMVEWNAPPLRFKQLGGAAFYCNWARLSLFSSGLFTNLASQSTRGAYGNIGAQIDFRLSLFSFLPSTFSTGYALATDKHGHTSTEYMISLKLL
jgi:hypothetical protein